MVLLMLLTLGCKLTHRQGKVYFDENTVPPNGIRVGPNFYCDQTEVGNIDWLEYMYWTGSVFGGNSKEYLATIPDTTVWMSQDTTLHDFVNFYLQSPGYRSNPVVGITYKQIIAYSEWRADRVLEVILVDKKVIRVNTEPTSENYFSIRKYLNGEYRNLEPDTNVKYYPHFRLATLEEWQRILVFSDSVNDYYRHKSRAFKKCQLNKKAIICDFSAPKENYQREGRCYFCPGPTRGYYFHCSAKGEPVLWDIRGNVCEFLSDSTLCAGGSWIHTEERILQSDTFHISGPNAYTGFRNVCEWRPIEELLDSKNK